MSVYYVSRCMDCGCYIAAYDESLDWLLVKRFILSQLASGLEVVRIDQWTLHKLAFHQCDCVTEKQLTLL
jgi:hypothetical protein